jgi:CBS domain-containing protein
MEPTKQIGPHSDTSVSARRSGTEPMKVADLMSSPAVICPETATFKDAADQMRERNVGAVVVVTDAGHVKTILTDRDICIAAAASGRPLDQLPVAVAGTVTALTCVAEDTVETAQGIMQVSSVRRLVVLDGDDRPMGVISIDDLAVEALRELERSDPEPAIPPEALVRTLGEIARAVARGHIPIPKGAEALPRPIL